MLLVAFLLMDIHIDIVVETTFQLSISIVGATQPLRTASLQLNSFIDRDIRVAHNFQAIKHTNHWMSDWVETDTRELLCMTPVTFITIAALQILPLRHQISATAVILSIIAIDFVRQCFVVNWFSECKLPDHHITRNSKNSETLQFSSLNWLLN